MIAVSSSSILYAYQLWFILYRGKPAILCCSSPNLFVYRQRLCCLGFKFTISATVLTVIRVESELRFSSATSISYPTSDFLQQYFRIQRVSCLIDCRSFFYCAVLVFTSLLFFFRTRAVFNTDPWILTAFFAALWLAVLGGCLALIVDGFEPITVDPAASNAVT